MKLGYECEGRLKGLWTLFIQATEVALFSKGIPVDRLSANDADEIKTVKHVYISDHTGIICPSNTSLNRWCDEDTPVTIEVTSIPKLRSYFPINVSFMLSVPHTKTFWNAEAGDQIKFSEGHAKRVLSCTVETMVKTDPSGFAGDRKIHVKPALTKKVPLLSSKPQSQSQVPVAKSKPKHTARPALISGHKPTPTPAPKRLPLGPNPLPGAMVKACAVSLDPTRAKSATKVKGSK
jgi:hypothetical protein